jgi:fructose-specific phosphotransferase system IIC component
MVMNGSKSRSKISKLKINMEIDINTLVVNGILIPPLLVFLTQWLKGLKENKKFHIVLPFILGFVFSFVIFGLGVSSILYGFLFGAIASGEYKILKS